MISFKGIIHETFLSSLVAIIILVKFCRCIKQMYGGPRPRYGPPRPLNPQQFAPQTFGQPLQGGGPPQASPQGFTHSQGIPQNHLLGLKPNPRFPQGPQRLVHPQQVLQNKPPELKSNQGIPRGPQGLFRPQGVPQSQLPKFKPNNQGIFQSPQTSRPQGISQNQPLEFRPNGGIFQGPQNFQGFKPLQGHPQNPQELKPPQGILQGLSPPYISLPNSQGFTPPLGIIQGPQRFKPPQGVPQEISSSLGFKSSHGNLQQFKPPQEFTVPIQPHDGFQPMQQLKPQSQTQPTQYGPPPLAHQILEPHSTNLQNSQENVDQFLKNLQQDDILSSNFIRSSPSNLQIKRGSFLQPLKPFDSGTSTHLSYTQLFSFQVSHNNLDDGTIGQMQAMGGGLLRRKAIFIPYTSLYHIVHIAPKLHHQLWSLLIHLLSSFS